MKTLFLALALSFAAAPAFADIRKDATLDVYSFNFRANRPMTVKVAIPFKTKDGCNSFRLSGDFRALGGSVPGSSLIQKFVADFDVSMTMMACPDKPERTIMLETDPFSIEPIHGIITGTLAVPAGAKVTME